ncbi:hypothetical protein HNP48_002669 [Acidovorax soli]|uniref:Uncharacterized protein n=1 Tax=Acidovorax soli TaxID=592050 RepID=A0A7X0U990_9BURK|nr:hypothetical protein [Acidovorax soli]
MDIRTWLTPKSTPAIQSIPCSPFLCGWCASRPGEGAKGAENAACLNLRGGASGRPAPFLPPDCRMLIPLY